MCVTGSRDATVKVWNVEAGTLVHDLRGHSAAVRCLEVAGDQIVSGSYDATCRVCGIHRAHRHGQVLIFVALGRRDWRVPTRFSRPFWPDLRCGIRRRPHRRWQCRLDRPRLVRRDRVSRLHACVQVVAITADVVPQRMPGSAARPHVPRWPIAAHRRYPHDGRLGRSNYRLQPRDHAMSRTAMRTRQFRHVPAV